MSTAIDGAVLTKTKAMRRVNDKLRPESKRMYRALGAERREQLGEYFIVDLTRANIAEAHVELGERARQLGVIKDWEKVTA